MTRDEATVDPDADDRRSSPTETATATIAATRTAADTADTAGTYPNTLTIIGQGTPSSFELTVDGELEFAGEDRNAAATVRSGSTVEGTVESGTVTVRFSGELTDVTFVDRGITGLSPATTPNVHVDYGAPNRSRS